MKVSGSRFAPAFSATKLISVGHVPLISPALLLAACRHSLHYGGGQFRQHIGADAG